MSNSRIRPTKLILVGQSPEPIYGFKALAYAPFSLLAFVRQNISEELQEFFSAEVLDFSHDDTPEKMAAAIIRESPSMVGFSVYIWNYVTLQKVSLMVKSSLPHTMIIFGGPQVSFEAEKIARENPHLDAVACTSANGEMILLSLIEMVMRRSSLANVPGIVYRDAQRELTKSAVSVPMPDLRQIPSPYSLSRDVFALDKAYAAALETSRGCPYDCGFCAWDKGRRKIEYFPLERCFADIDYIFNHPKVMYVDLIDADLLSNPKRAKALLEYILKQKRRIYMAISINFSHLTEETSKLLAALPNFEFEMAVQTTNPSALHCMGRDRITPEIFTNKLTLLKRWVPEATLQAELMLGLPADDYEGFIGSLDYVIGLEVHHITIHYPVFLLPGSRFYEQREQHGISYNPEPPYYIIETVSFPKADIERALRLTMWVQILTYYYPAIREIFYSLARRDGVRIGRVQKWVAAFENQICIMPVNEQMTDFAILTISDLNQKKKLIIREACKVRVASVLYRIISELEDSMLTVEEKNKLDTAAAIFEYLNKLHGDQIGYDSEVEIPDRLLKDVDASELSLFFSIIK